MGLPVVSTIVESWNLFSPKEKRNIALYIVGIMLYKFGLEGNALHHLLKPLVTVTVTVTHQHLSH